MVVAAMAVVEEAAGRRGRRRGRVMVLSCSSFSYVSAHVGELTVAGEVGALVQGAAPLRPRAGAGAASSPTTSRTSSSTPSPGGRAAHAAALLDGELPPAVLDDVGTAGLDLLPRARGDRASLLVSGLGRSVQRAAAVCDLVRRRARPRSLRAVPPARPRPRRSTRRVLRARRARASGGGAAAPARERRSGSVKAGARVRTAPQRLRRSVVFATMPPVAKAGRPRSCRSKRPPPATSASKG